MLTCLRDTVHVDGVCGFQAWEEGWGPGDGEVANVGCLVRVRCVWTLLISGLGILSSRATGSTLVLGLSWRCWLCECTQLSLVSPEELSFLILTWRVGGARL